MTDKQIIIDGVDVSGCELYKNTNWKNCYSRDYKESVCQSNHNCLYKQLKLKERKCDMWENIAVDNGEVALKYQQQIDQLKAERDSYIDKYFLESQKVSKLNKTLKEIKEIAEICQCHNTDSCYECKYFDDCEVEDEEIPTRDVCKLILQKISEVKDE